LIWLVTVKRLPLKLTPIQITSIALVVTALIGATLWQPRAH
jgi:hypothetical protein